METDNIDREIEKKEESHVVENQDFVEEKELIKEEIVEEKKEEEIIEEKPKVKEEKPLESKQAKEGSFKPLILIMLASLAIAGFWDKVPWIKDNIHSVLDPSTGILLDWNIVWGMVIITFIITLITTLFQKYTTDQKTLREMKKNQKDAQKEMNKYKDHPEKLMEFQKQQFGSMGKMMKLSMRPMIFTGIPIILFFRWFMDYFDAIPDYRFLGFLSWFWFYFIISIVISSVLRKVLKVV